jgi:hypothetical protein
MRTGDNSFRSGLFPCRIPDLNVKRKRWVVEVNTGTDKSIGRRETKRFKISNLFFYLNKNIV